jgi:RNA polymerase sigma factor (TIGR02999 family)
MADAGDITALLARWSGGDAAALDALTPLVYAELRKIAEAYLRGERTGHTLQPTALVHEAWMRLARPGETAFATRSHFYALAARIMRRVLVDWARAQHADKRGAGARPLTLDASTVFHADRTEDFLALDESLTSLGQVSPRMARIIELRYFGGFSVTEVAELLGTSAATVSRDQHAAEAWLSHAMGLGKSC